MDPLHATVTAISFIPLGIQWAFFFGGLMWAVLDAIDRWFPPTYSKAERS